MDTNRYDGRRCPSVVCLRKRFTKPPLPRSALRKPGQSAAHAGRKRRSIVRHASLATRFQFRQKIRGVNGLQQHLKLVPTCLGLIQKIGGRCLAGEQKHPAIPIALPDLDRHVDPGHSRHHDVADNPVRAVNCAGGQRALSVVECSRFKSAGAENGGQCTGNDPLIIHHKNSRSHHVPHFPSNPCCVLLGDFAGSGGASTAAAAGSSASSRGRAFASTSETGTTSNCVTLFNAFTWAEGSPILLIRGLFLYWRLVRIFTGG